MIKLSGKILIKILYELPFSENLTMQPQVSNIPTVLVCSSMDKLVLIYVLGVFTHCTLTFRCFLKSKVNSRNTRAGNQKCDLPLRLTVPEIIWCVHFIKSRDNDL